MSNKDNKRSEQERSPADKKVLDIQRERCSEIRADINGTLQGFTSEASRIDTFAFVPSA
jgi:hypothetical protein